MRSLKKNSPFKPSNKLSKKISNPVSYDSVEMNTIDQRVAIYANSIKFDEPKDVTDSELIELRVAFTQQKADAISNYKQALENRKQTILNMEKFLQNLGIVGLQTELDKIKNKTSKLSRTKRDFLVSFANR